MEAAPGLYELAFDVAEVNFISSFRRLLALRLISERRNALSWVVPREKISRPIFWDEGVFFVPSFNLKRQDT
ncbi:hypothetical protein SAMN05216243_1964 [Sediminibacillus albus]|uniref:Uncharacterized protein n=1 Tax=Sediminibacillus albus TaxID=407036 RepID=A0A1G8Z504_9BACI|nr:hypothetical protein SAMN05216243_1964 [Sediminibacillus albus]